jgi:hypothetical protein
MNSSHKMNFLKSVSVFHTIVLLFSILPVVAQNNEDKFKPKTSKENAKTGRLFGKANQYYTPQNQEQRDRLEDVNVGMSMFSVLGANTGNIWDAMTSSEIKRGNYNIKSISGKDLFEVSYEYKVADYKFNLSTPWDYLFINDSFYSAAVGPISFSDSEKYNTLNFSYNNNISPSWDNGLKMSITHGNHLELSYPFLISAGGNTADGMASLDVTSINFSLAPYFQFNQKIYGNDVYKGSIFANIAIPVSYQKVTTDIAVSAVDRATGIAFAQSADYSDGKFDIGADFEIGSEIWFNSLCLRPSFGLDEEMDHHFSVGSYWVWGFYDSIFFEYSNGENDYTDWQAFTIGVNITDL